ncbi:MAG: DUF192 domain-containing protein, partial [Actinomycetota bacterium]|nr:DUF192 domain-containing protein [Actinomycetota bacterium]
SKVPPGSSVRSSTGYPRIWARNLLQVKICVSSSEIVVASEVRWARSALGRARGLMGQSAMPPGTAMVFEPARQIHTFGMKFPLDVVFCDRTWKVLHVVRSMAPARMTRVVWRARYVLELRGDSLPAGVDVGQSLVMMP